MDIYLAVPISNIVRGSCQIVYHFIISDFQIVLKINPFRSLLRNRKYYIHILKYFRVFIYYNGSINFVSAFSLRVKSGYY